MPSQDAVLFDAMAQSPCRRACAKALKSVACEVLVAVLVIFGLVLEIVEVDSPSQESEWVRYAGLLILTVFCIECAIRLYTYRWKFFLSIYNVMDLFIIASELLSNIIMTVAQDSIPSLVMLRFLRLLRLTRSIRVIVKFPQLSLIVKGLMNATSAVVYGVALLFVVLLVFGIIAVQFIHPVNQRVSLSGAYDDCPRCERAFETVFHSALTFVQQILAGDSWGQVTIPIIEEAPETAAFFALVFVFIHISLLNVILAVIVDTAMRTSREDVDEVVKKRHREFKNTALKFERLCRELDRDGSGDLSEEEIMLGLEANDDFRRQLASMDINTEDMHIVFSILDADSSGTVNYTEFVQELYKMKSHDSHTLLIFIKHYVAEIRSKVQEHMNVIKTDIISKLQQESMLIRRESVFSKGESFRRGSVECTTIGPPQMKDHALATPQESIMDLGEELRRLRNVISEDLAKSMKDMVKRSDTQTRLLASIAGDTASWNGSSGGTTNTAQMGTGTPESEVGKQALSAEQDKPQSTRQLDDGRPPSLHGASCPAGVRTAQKSLATAALQPPPDDAWAMRNCCSVWGARTGRSTRIDVMDSQALHTQAH